MTAPPFRQVLLCCFFGRNLGSQGSLHVSLSPTNMDPHTSSASLSLSLSVGFKCLYCIYSTLCHWDRRAIWTSLFRCSDPAIYICIYSIYIYIIATIIARFIRFYPLSSCKQLLAITAFCTGPAGHTQQGCGVGCGATPTHSSSLAMRAFNALASKYFSSFSMSSFFSLSRAISSFFLSCGINGFAHMLYVLDACQAINNSAAAEECAHH